MEPQCLEMERSLPAGIIKVEGSFLKGDNILIADQNGEDCARGITSFSSDEISKVKGLKVIRLKKFRYSSKSEISQR